MFHPRHQRVESKQMNNRQNFLPLAIDLFHHVMMFKPA